MANTSLRNHYNLNYYKGLLLNKDCDGCEASEGDWFFYLVNGQLKFTCQKNGLNPIIITSNTVNDNTWHFASATRNNSNGELTLYLDGILQDNNFSGTGVIDNIQPLTFGRYAQTGINYFSGLGNEISVWNTVLTQSEIQDYMNCPPTGNEAGLIGYWSMDEGTGTTLTDLSGNGNDGTINGATWSNNTPTQICDNCTTTDSIYVEILDVDIVQNDTTICQGDSVELSLDLEPIPAIGDYFEGGYIFHIDSANGYALIAGDTILGTAEYGCYGQAIIGADDSIIGSGLQNTLDILNN